MPPSGHCRNPALPLPVPRIRQDQRPLRSQAVRFLLPQSLLPPSPRARKPARAGFPRPERLWIQWIQRRQRPFLRRVLPRIPLRVLPRLLRTRWPRSWLQNVGGPSPERTSALPRMEQAERHWRRLQGDAVLLPRAPTLLAGDVLLPHAPARGAAGLPIPRPPENRALAAWPQPVFR